MTSLEIKRVKDTVTAALLEQSLSSTDCCLENGQSYAGIQAHRAELIKKLYRTTCAMITITGLCVGLLLLYQNCNIQTDNYAPASSVGILPADDTRHSSWNSKIDAEIMVKINIHAPGGHAAGATFALTGTSPDESCTADPSDHHTGYSPGGLLAHSSIGLVIFQKPSADSGPQQEQERTYEPRSAQSGKSKTAPYRLDRDSGRSLGSDEDPNISHGGPSTPPRRVERDISHKAAVKKGKDMQKLLDQSDESRDSGAICRHSDLRKHCCCLESGPRLEAPPEVDKIMRSHDPALTRNLFHISEFQHSRESMSGGFRGTKQHPNTGAYCKQYFEPNKGVIFALGNFGPEDMGVTQVPSVIKSQLPPWKSWSDVVSLEWMKRIKDNPAAKTNLHKVLRCEVSTPSTIDIMRQTLQNMDKDPNGPIAYEDRVSVRRDSDDFRAVLGSENGYGVAYLLSQPKMSSGLRLMVSIDIWRPGPHPCLMFNIQRDPRSKVAKPTYQGSSDKTPVPGGSGTHRKRDHEPRSAQVGKGKSPANLELAPAPDQGLESSSSADTSSMDDSDAFEPLHGRMTYDQAIAKGSKYLQLMKQRNKSKEKSCTEEEAQKQGWVDHSDADIWTPSGIATLLAAFAPNFNTPGSLTTSDWRHLNNGKGSWLKKFRPTGASYQQIINARAGAIFITNTHGPKEEGPKQSPPVTVFPDLQHLSDFSYMAWSEAAKESKRSRKTLQKVVRCSINNKDTKRIIAHVTNKAQPASLPYAKRMSFQAGSKQYLALLGTENGVGVAYLLAEHQTTLGWKVVDSIEVFYDQGFAYIVFNIRDAVPKSDRFGAGGPSKTLSRRAGRYNTKVNLATAENLGGPSKSGYLRRNLRSTSGSGPVAISMKRSDDAPHVISSLQDELPKKMTV